MLDTASVGPPILAAIRNAGGWAVVRDQQGETERGILRPNVPVDRPLTDTPALERLAALSATWPPAAYADRLLTIF